MTHSEQHRHSVCPDRAYRQLEAKGIEPRIRNTTNVVKVRELQEWVLGGLGLGAEKFSPEKFKFCLES